MTNRIAIAGAVLSMRMVADELFLLRLCILVTEKARMLDRRKETTTKRVATQRRHDDLS